MKRALCAVLMMALLAANVPGGLAEDELHELWGIPFGATGEEVVERVFEKTGITLEKETWDNIPDRIFYQANEIDGLTIYGFPVESISFQISSKLSFNDSTEKEVDPPQYIFSSIYFEKYQFSGATRLEVLDTGINGGYDRYEKLIALLTENYGDFDFITLYRSGFNTDPHYQLCDSAEEGKSLTYESLQGKDYNYISIETHFGNVCVQMSFFSMDGAEFSNSVDITYKFEPYLIPSIYLTPSIVEEKEGGGTLDIGLD